MYYIVELQLFIINMLQKIIIKYITRDKPQNIPKDNYKIL